MHNPWIVFISVICFPGAPRHVMAEKGRFPLDNLRKSRIWGLGGLGTIFIANFIESVVHKLRGIILLHLALVASLFHFDRPRKPLICTIFGFLDVSMAPQTDYFTFWAHQSTQNNSRTKTQTFQNILFWEISEY